MAERQTPPSSCSATSRQDGPAHRRRPVRGRLEAPRPAPRDLSLVTVADLAATYRPDQLGSHLRLALANGLTQDELVEALTHLAPGDDDHEVPALRTSERLAADRGQRGPRPHGYRDRARHVPVTRGPHDNFPPGDHHVVARHAAR